MTLILLLPQKFAQFLVWCCGW